MHANLDSRILNLLSEGMVFENVFSKTHGRCFEIGCVLIFVAQDIDDSVSSFRCCAICIMHILNWHTIWTYIL